VTREVENTAAEGAGPTQGALDGSNSRVFAFKADLKSRIGVKVLARKPSFQDS